MSGSLLARLELLHVPPTDGHVTLVLIHAVGEALDVRGTGSRGFGRGRLGVKGVVHGSASSGVRVGRCLLLLLFGWRRRAAAEKSSDRMTD